MPAFFRTARIACLAGALAAGLAVAGPARAADLAVAVGPDKTRAAGALMVALFAAAASWLKPEEAHALVRLAPGRSSGEVVLRDLPPGRYALLAFVDVNGNGQLDRDADGRPTEPFGVSGKSGDPGPPGFDEAAIDVKEGGNVARIILK